MYQSRLDVDNSGRQTHLIYGPMLSTHGDDKDEVAVEDVEAEEPEPKLDGLFKGKA